MEIRINLDRVQIYAILAFFVAQKCTKIMLLKSANCGSLNMNKHKFNKIYSFRKHNSSLCSDLLAKQICYAHFLFSCACVCFCFLSFLSYEGFL